MHGRKGLQVHCDSLMAKVRGLDWRRHFDACGTRAEWDANCKEFVVAACCELGLPDPPKYYTTAPLPWEESTRDKINIEYNLENIPIPEDMKRDRMFDPRDCHQVEFVVDNQCLAGLANATAAITNPYYRPCIRLIHRRRKQERRSGAWTKRSAGALR